MLTELEVLFMRRAAIASSFPNLSVAGLVSGLLVGVGLLAGCPDRSISKVDPLQGRVEFKDIPVTVNRDIDLLFLIDDSPSMGDKQTNLAANFPEFIKVLKTIPGGLPNVHIAVVTSDMGTKGAADPAAGPAIGTPGQGGCSGSGKNGVMQLFGAPVTGANYIVDVQQPPGMPPNYTGKLEDVFATMARAGAGGCGFEQHLEAMKQALQENLHPGNMGFLRPNAYLAVIIIADEDDCSLAHSTLLTSNENGPLGALQSFRCTRFGVVCDTNGTTSDAMNVVNTKDRCHPADNSAYLTKVADYVKFLKDLKPSDPSKVIVAGIMGTTQLVKTEMRPPLGSTTPLPALAHSCNYIGGDGKTEVADPPIRLKFFLDQFPNRSTFAPICQQDLSGGLTQIGELLKTVIGDPCIEGKLVGPPYQCSVSSVTDPGKATEVETIMPKCNPEDGSGTTEPCWHVVATDAATCPNADHLTLKIEHEDTLRAQNMDTHVLANCVTQVIDTPL
jgi:hypothetical protein